MLSFATLIYYRPKFNTLTPLILSFNMANFITDTMSYQSLVKNVLLLTNLFVTNAILISCFIL